MLFKVNNQDNTITPKTYLGPCEVSMVECLCKNSEQVLH